MADHLNGDVEKEQTYNPHEDAGDLGEYDGLVRYVETSLLIVIASKSEPGCTAPDVFESRRSVFLRARSDHRVLTTIFCPSIACARNRCADNLTTAISPSTKMQDVVPSTVVSRVQLMTSQRSVAFGKVPERLLVQTCKKYLILSY